MDLVTGSDHNLIWGELCTAPFLEFRSLNRSKANEKNIPKRKIYLYNDATEEIWENYKTSLDSILSQKEQIDLFQNTQSLCNKDEAEAFINKE